MLATVIILNTALVIAITTAVVSLMTWGILSDQPTRRVRGESRRRTLARRRVLAIA
jgi:hypothetical protein